MEIRPAGMADVPLIATCVDRAYRHYVERIAPSLINPVAGPAHSAFKNAVVKSQMILDE